MKYSVIIPTLNAEDCLKGCLKSIATTNRDVEVIVADGQSTDQTTAIALANHANICIAQKGRGIQLNEGAECASGDVLLFLHADSLLPKDAFNVLDQAFGQEEAQVATFQMQFDHPHWLLKFYSKFTKYDSLWTSFGDQCIVVRKKFFDNVIKFPSWELFEDVHFLREARYLTDVKTLPATVTTSAQKYIENGLIKQQLKNAWLILRYLIKTPSNVLYRNYYG